LTWRTLMLPFSRLACAAYPAMLSSVIAFAAHGALALGCWGRGERELYRLGRWVDWRSVRSYPLDSRRDGAAAGGTWTLSCYALRSGPVGKRPYDLEARPISRPQPVRERASVTICGPGRGQPWGSNAYYFRSLGSQTRFIIGRQGQCSRWGCALGFLVGRDRRTDCPKAISGPLAGCVASTTHPEKTLRSNARGGVLSPAHKNPLASTLKIDAPMI